MVTRIIKSLKSTKSIAYTRGREDWNMHYELYIDLFFLINFSMDYFLLLMVGKMLKCRIRRRRDYCGSNGQCVSDLHICGLFARKDMEACVVSRSHEYVSVENRTLG